MKEEKHSLVTTLEDRVFQFKLAHLCDIFKKLNQLNISLQRRDIHILQLFNKLTAFKRKLRLWKTGLLENGKQCNGFPLLKSHLSSLSGNPSLHCSVKNVIYWHFDLLISHFDKYFSEYMDKYKWIKNPFVDNAIAPQGFTFLAAEQFIDLSSDPL